MLKRSFLILLIQSVHTLFPTILPTLLFSWGGGVWTKLLGKFLFATNGNSDQKVGNTGGEYTHTLTSTEIPKFHGELHCHSEANGGIFYESSGIVRINTTQQSRYFRPDDSAGVNGASSGGAFFIDFGNGQGHNNMPPYYITNIWRRIG